jgi:hypothetical protein
MTSGKLDDALEARLRRLRGPDPEGDWLDVRRRAQRSRRRTVALAAAAALLVAVPTIAVGGRLLDVLGVTSSDQTVPTTSNAAPVPHIHADLVFIPGRSPFRLAMPVLAPLLGHEEPLAVPTAAWTDVVYHAWDGTVGRDDSGGTPLLRRVDLRSGTDTVYARGAQSVAIGRDGRVAYMKASRPRYEPSPQGTLGGRVGHVVVASSLDAPAERWTRHEGEYVVLAWARGTLLVESLPGPGYHPPVGHEPPPGVYALDRAGSIRALPMRGLVALSPDGRRALGWWSDGDSGSRGVRLVDVATGAIIGRSPLNLARRGAWHEDRVVARIGGRPDKLVVVRVPGRALVTERVFSLEDDPAVRGTYGPFLGSPVFRDDGRSVIMRIASVTAPDGARFERARFVGFLTCDLEARACIRGRNLLPPTKWGAIVHNPSRPAAVRVRCDPIAFVPNSDDIASAIVATRVSCAEAEKLIRFIRRTHSFVNGARRFRARGFVCSVSVDTTALPVARYSCRSGHRYIRWEKR